jgi:drug/metabolite transporter (DMT)-like permease
MENQDYLQHVEHTNDNNRSCKGDRDHEENLTEKNLRNHCTPVRILSVLIYLIFWVSNGERMQGVANGTMAPEPFDRPAFLSWFSYNFMLLSWIPLILYCRFFLHCTVREYFRSSWAGPSGFGYMLGCSYVMQMLLLALNILWIIGLNHISVAVSNAVYQLQAAVTVGLSVWCLGSYFAEAEGIGIVISLVGVVLIVIPPLVEESQDAADSDNNSILRGIIATLVSAVIWAIYQISWRILSKDKPEMLQLDGLIDTFATLGVMGLCNLLLGWPVLLLVHWAGVERFYLPAWNMMPALTINGLIEYTFDVSLAVAIYLTSPVVTAMTAPLTIPIALVWDHYLHNSPFQVGNYDWIGSLLVLIGVVWMELKIPLTCFIRKPETEHPYNAMSVAFT